MVAESNLRLALIATYWITGNARSNITTVDGAPGIPARYAAWAYQYLVLGSRYCLQDGCSM